jgi:hypothetical protein
MVADDADVVRLFPSHFGDGDDSIPRARERYLAMDCGPLQVRSAPAPRAASVPLTRQKWFIPESVPGCRGSREPSATKVRIQREAYADLAKIYEETAGHDRLETGGLGFGFDNGSVISVLAFSGPGDAQRGRDSFAPSPAHSRQMIAEMAGRNLDLVLEFHSHAHHRALGRADLRAHSGRRKSFGLQRCCALLLTGDGLGFDMDAWIIAPNPATGEDEARPTEVLL